MLKDLGTAIKACVITFLLCAIAYPATVWGLAQLMFPHQAEGSLIFNPDRTVIGSELIAQRFGSDRYFQPRPSAVDYKADAAAGSNLATTNPDLHDQIATRVRVLGGSKQQPVPVDLVTASGSGLDPDISPEAANYQAPRIAAARGIAIEQLRDLIIRQTNSSGAILGAPPRVNVLLLNLALDKEPPSTGR
jgi:potassium-transporting ATPase KdpC subunit